MKKLISTLLTCLLAVSLFAIKKKPEYDIEIGPSYKPKLKIGNVFEEIVGQDKESFFVMRTKFMAITIGFIPIVVHDFYIARYSKSDLSLEWSRPVFPKNYFGKGKTKPTGYSGVYQLKDKFLALFYNTDKKKKEVTAFAQMLDEEGELDGDMVELESIKVDKGEKYGYFNFRFSNDSSKVLVYYAKNTKKKENPAYRFHIYNDKLEKMGERDVEIPYMDKDVDIHSVLIDNDGNVFTLLKIKEDEKVKGKVVYTFKIFKFGFNEDDVEEFEIAPKGADGGLIYLHEMMIHITDDELICTGFYGKQNSASVSGAFNVRYDKDGRSELASDLLEFDREFIEEFYSEKQIKKADKKGKELNVPAIVTREMIYREDGSCLLIGEQHYTYTVCYSTGRGTVCHTYYVYNDIIVVKISPDGEISWAKKIPKRSVDGSGGFYLGFALLDLKDKLVFIFNDNPKNLRMKDPKKVESLGLIKGSVLVAVNVEEDEGESERVQIYDYPDKGAMYFRPRFYQQVNPKEVVFPMFAKGKEAIGRVTFKGYR